jgi:hypothetical protein
VTLTVDERCIHEGRVHETLSTPTFTSLPCFGRGISPGKWEDRPHLRISSRTLHYFDRTVPGKACKDKLKHECLGRRFAMAYAEATVGVLGFYHRYLSSGYRGATLETRFFHPCVSHDSRNPAPRKCVYKPFANGV